VVHGEPPAQAVMAREIEKRFKVPVSIPARGDSVELD
jgi:predicted metal-dependent RNase